MNVPPRAPETDTESFALRLVAFLRSVLPDVTDLRITGLHRIGGGNSRENWPFDAEWTQGEETVRASLILRRDPPAGLLENNSTREFTLLRALHDHGLAVPEPLWLDAEGRWLDRPFMILRRYDGTVDRGILRQTNALALDQEARRALAHQYCELLAQLHNLDVTTVPLTAPPLESIPQTAVDEWEARAADVQLEPQPELAMAFAWLRAHLPDTSRVVLVHGDFRPGNSLVTAAGLEVMLDWETAHLGDPLEDVAWHLAPYYRKEHLIPGAWDRDDFLAEYQRLTGIDVGEDALDFWTVLSNVMFCVMGLAGIHAFCLHGAQRVTSPTPRLFQQLVRTIDAVEAKVAVP